MTASSCLRATTMMVAICSAASGLLLSAEPRLVEDIVPVLEQAGDRVKALFSRAQSILCLETVTILPLDSGMARVGFGRTVESELHLWWDAVAKGPSAIAAQVRRRVRSVNKRPPRANDPNNCTVPEQNEAEPQPLALLLPDQRDDYEFTPAGHTRMDGRTVLMVDFRERAPVSVEVRAIEGNDNCIAYDVNGGMRGRLWLDPETMDVLRLDQHLSGLVDVRVPAKLARRVGVESGWTLERWDMSTRFATVHFSDPDETLVLPRSSTTMRVTRGAGTPRIRTETKYTDYQRFLTSARLVPD